VNGLHSYSPDWNNNGHFVMQNPDTSPGQPYYLVANNVGIATYTPGGLVTSGSHAGTYFGVGGTLNQFALGPNSGQWQIGGDGKYATSGILGTDSLVPDQDRGSAFVRGDYDITPDITVFAQGSYARYKGLGYYIQPTDKGVVIQGDNAYLPAGWQGESFTLGTNNADFPKAGSNNTRDTQRYVVGGNGSFSVLNKGFKWDAYYQKGITETDEKLIGVWNRNKLLLATDAVFNPSNPSQIVCRSTLTDPTNGCVPIDRFGIGVASQAALSYLLGNPERKQRLTQDVGGINLNTNDIQGWAGPISVAVGFEARKEQVVGEVNPIYSSGWKYGNYQVTQGSYNVKEGYVETVVPVIAGLELNGAARFTDYSTSGSVTTWKAGLTYSPLEDIKFRASRSNDIRAPDLDELFATGSARTNSGTLNGQNIQYVQALKGSTLLSPEQAHSWGAGFVLTPRFAPGFSLSVDYYDIVISKVIDNVSADQTLLFCSSGIQAYCNNIIGPVNNFYTVNLYYQNLDSLVSRGLDVEASYRAALGDIIPGAVGDLALRLMATHYINNTTNNGSAAINMAGANDQYGSTPNWIYRLSAIYKLESWTADLTARGVSAGVVSHALTQCSTNCPAVTADNYPYLTINDNHVAGAFYLDGSLTRSFAVGKSEGEVFLALTNILDKNPPLSVEPDYIGNEDTPGEPQTNRDLYDVLGRTWRMGVRFQL
jgi:outer membrane receptor protein involved in Fe transport